MPLGTPVTVPEAAVDENCLTPASEYDIRPSRQVLAMEAIAVSHGVEATPDDHFRLCVAALDGLHDAAALLGGAGVHENKNQIVSMVIYILRRICSILRVMVEVNRETA